ncbi:hypothetical protein KIW84_020392 [Lathyrus oleraceus]|uniref:Uncharacterized protein n=1 Tax=Pisum sativum TaxID=3888 RepID=A0A9D4Y708_PEA|nr:hypothetical protein KIW84_020392 [Pisum sativum]
MANFPSCLFSINNDESFVAPLSASTQTSATVQRMAYMERLVIELQRSDLRENILHVLSKCIGLFKDLAPLLWKSVGTIVLLLQEILSIFPNISLQNLTPAQSTRVRNVLALFQVEQVMEKMFKCVVHHSGMLKDLGYSTVDKLWYYDEMNACDIVLLEDDKGTKRMQTIAVMTMECHLYVTHHVS